MDMSPHKSDFVNVNGIYLHYLDGDGEGFGFTNLAPTIAAKTIKNNTVTPPHMPATVNEAASPLSPTSLFSKTLCEPSAYVQVNSVK
jgi:hypothetical protein